MLHRFYFKSVLIVVRASLTFFTNPPLARREMKEEDKNIGCFTIGKGSATRDVLQRLEIPQFFKDLPDHTSFCLKTHIAY